MFYEIKNNIHLFLSWYIALNKRLIRRIEFITMVISLPLLVLGLMTVATQKKGLLDIGIVVKDGSEAEIAVENLLSQKSVVDFTEYKDEKEAKAELIKGELDAVWILPDSLENIDADSIRIIQTENSTVKNIAREKLYSVLYSYIAHSEYIKYMDTINIDDTDALDKYLEDVSTDGEFIKFEGIDGESPYDKLDYITYPIRGFMCIWLFVGVVIANIYFLSDERRGLFSMIDLKLKRVVAPAYSAGISINLTLIMLLTLFITNQAGDIVNEISAILMLLVSFILLVDILKKFCSIEILEAMLVPFILFFMIFSPILFDVRIFGIEFIPRLNPIYYYLNLIADSGFIREFGVFIVALSALNIIISLINKKG